MMECETDMDTKSLIKPLSGKSGGVFREILRPEVLTFVR